MYSHSIYCRSPTLSWILIIAQSISRCLFNHLNVALDYVVYVLIGVFAFALQHNNTQHPEQLFESSAGFTHLAGWPQQSAYSG